ncbi:MAG: YjbH domain-containing protein, partial [Chlamydiota bacterium]
LSTFMKFFYTILIIFFSSYLIAGTERSLFDDLALVEAIDKELKDTLPFFYNQSMMGGYFTMPSARMASSGMAAAGAATVPPYNVYGVNFQVFQRIELSANYRVYKGCLEGNFGNEGFGDDADRIGNIKIGILIPEDGLPHFPNFSIGADDFMGSKRFNSQYIVATKQWLSFNLETTLGWGRGRIKGFFGGISWTPLRKRDIPFLKNISLVAEYDANNYKKHHHEHPEGRNVKSRINVGINYLGFDALQLSVSSIRGEKIAGAASLRFPLGTTRGLFPKIDEASPYCSPVDTEPLGIIRLEKEFAHELVYAFADQGLNLYRAYLTFDRNLDKELWLKVVNNRYRLESVVRDRLYHLLSALTPANIKTVVVVMEEDGVPSHSYRFRREDLYRYQRRIISDEEMHILSPMQEAQRAPKEYESDLLFQRNKRIWTFTFRPRLLTYFGGAKGKFKYDFGVIASPEGYLFDEVYYKLQIGYSIKSSLSDLSATDRLNPSHLPNVRTDSIRYFQSNSLSIEKAYVQKGWNLGKGFFARLATGYFEAAYGGVALETLYYPVNTDWAVGIEGATVWKRRYRGIKFTTNIREVHGHHPEYKHFVGIQYFLSLYYQFKPLSLQFKALAGQFLAKDLGARFEVERVFPSGLRFGIWYTLTNGHDKVNGQTYYDKGFFFALPLDMFLKQSSRNFISYAMSAWLRDVGATAETGKQLYPTLNEQRFYGR